jgi:RIO-like serine/threonine protein kinase
VDLRQLAETNHPLLRDRKWFESMSTKLAKAVAQLHQHRFAHNDLNWRNILVVPDDDPQVYLIDCARGRRWIAPFLQFRIVKDLTHLDKFGQVYLSRTQRLRFYLTYCGERRLSAASKRRLRRVLARQVGARHQQTDYSAAADNR